MEENKVKYSYYYIMEIKVKHILFCLLSIILFFVGIYIFNHGFAWLGIFTSILSISMFIYTIKTTISKKIKN